MKVEGKVEYEVYTNTCSLAKGYLRIYRTCSLFVAICVFMYYRFMFPQAALSTEGRSLCCSDCTDKDCENRQVN